MDPRDLSTVSKPEIMHRELDGFDRRNVASDYQHVVRKQQPGRIIEFDAMEVQFSEQILLAHPTDTNGPPRSRTVGICRQVVTRGHGWFAVGVVCQEDNCSAKANPPDRPDTIDCPHELNRTGQSGGLCTLDTYCYRDLPWRCCHEMAKTTWRR